MHVQGVCRLHAAVQAYVHEEEEGGVGRPPMEHHGSQPTHAPGTLERVLEANLAVAHTRTGQQCSLLRKIVMDRQSPSRCLHACVCGAFCGSQQRLRGAMVHACVLHALLWPLLCALRQPALMGWRLGLQMHRLRRSAALPACIT